ncbi:hypothetical protein [Bosea sp. NBC_00550]|uniref:hypothetical protein n=1 Tax=Bosea sp. NBC_00550 TaxID=2969621 RepID=UPI002F3FFC9B
MAEIEFRAWTADGKLRHGSYRGLREDADELPVYEIRSGYSFDRSLRSRAEQGDILLKLNKDQPVLLGYLSGPVSRNLGPVQRRFPSERVALAEARKSGPLGRP